MDSEITEIVNGINVYSLTNTNLHSFCIRLYIKAGSMYEQKFDNGISHLFEHAVFRNLKQKYGGAFYELLAENGIWLNGTTNPASMTFTVAGSPKGAAFGIEVILSVFDELNISRKELNAEKQRILAEIREGGYYYSLSGFTDRLYWKGTSLQKSILGTQKNALRFTGEKLNEFRSAVLSKNSVFFCVTGNVSEASLKKLYEGIGKLDLPGEPGKWDYLAPVPPSFGNRTFRLHVQEADYYKVSLRFDVDTAACPIGVRDLIYAILFWWDDALFNMVLSEDTGLIYSFDSYSPEHNNIGYIGVEYEIDKRDVIPSLEQSVRVFRMLKRGEFSFEGNMQKVIVPVFAELDNAEDLNESLAYSNHLFSSGRLDRTKEKCGRYDHITKQDIMYWSKRIFRPENLFITFKGKRSYLQSLDIASVIEKLAEDEAES